MPRMKICPVCGREFLSKNGARYCGDKCRKIQESRRGEEYRKRQAMKVPLVKECPICGRAFTPNTVAIYCSDECRRKAVKKLNADYQRERRKINRRMQGVDECRCAWCGKVMTKNEIYYADPAEENWIFCSRECAIATFTDKFFAMKAVGEIQDKVNDLGIDSVNVVR